ncbi:MAG: hypothetical protein P1U77_12440 [Rubripirellula sp.]|nr:hypothetical protein [Rubripirellula sp.]
MAAVGSLDRSMQVAACMSHFYLHPDDRRWLKRWFRNNLVCVAAIIAFVSILHVSAVVQESVNANSVREQGEAVIPEGWRRTAKGWVHTSQWHFSQAEATSIPKLPRGVQLRWLGDAMETVRRTSPLVIAMMQIASVAIIICLSRRTPRSVRAGEVHPIS